MYPDDYLNKEDESTIYFFSLPYEAFNNWSAHAVEVWGLTFPTVEHAYQYKKYIEVEPGVAKRIQHAPSPWAAYQISLAEKAKTPASWDENKLSVMEELLRAKLDQNLDVKELLKKSGSRTIIENSPWDTFWGCGKDGKGENNLGKLWMKLRSELV